MVLLQYRNFSLHTCILFMRRTLAGAYELQMPCCTCMSVFFCTKPIQSLSRQRHPVCFTPQIAIAYTTAAISFHRPRPVCKNHSNRSNTFSAPSSSAAARQTCLEVGRRRQQKSKRIFRIGELNPGLVGTDHPAMIESDKS